MKGRLKIAVAMMAFVIAICAMSSVAFAAQSWQSKFPVSTENTTTWVYGQPQIVSAELFGVAINPSSVTMKVNNVTTRAFVQTGTDAGSWTFSQVLNANNVWVAHWAWVAGGAADKTTVYCFPSTVPTGSIGVTVTANDLTGTAVTAGTWSFTVATVPTPIVTPDVDYSAESNEICAGCHEEFATDIAMGPNCVDCHNGDYASPTHLGMGNSAPAPGAVAADGHNISGNWGAKTAFDGSQGITMEWEAEDASASLAATWSAAVPVGGVISGGTTTTAMSANGFQFAMAPFTTNIAGGVPITSVTIGQEGTMTTNWAFPTQQTFWDASSESSQSFPPNTMTFLTKDSVIKCTDCHDGTGITYGPQGAISWGMDTDFPGDYSMASLTKQVTCNTGFASATLAGQTEYDATYKQVVLKSSAALTDTMTAANTGLQTIETDSPFFTRISPSGIMVRSSMSRTMNNKTRLTGTTGANAVICAKCHDLENPVAYGNGMIGVVGGNLAHNSHHQDQTDGSDQCVSCHVGITHAWKAPRLLVNTVAERDSVYVDNRMLGTSRTNAQIDPAQEGMFLWDEVTDTWSKPSRTAYQTTGWARIGMLSLSAVDQHFAVKDSPDPFVSTANGAGLSAVGTDNMIYWSEASCQACGAEHSGEDAIRIKSSLGE